MAFDAFVRASAFCHPARPASQRSRRAQPRQDMDFELPLPEPPATRLAQRRRRPFSALTTKLVRPAASEEAEFPPAQKEADSCSDDVPLPPAKLKHRGAITVVPNNTKVLRAKTGRMSLKKGIAVEDLVEHNVGESLLRRRLKHTRLAEMRVLKFDGRVCNSKKLDEDLVDEDLAGNELQNGLTELEVDGRGEHAEAGLDEVPYKLVEASSERSGFLPTNVIESRSCWQSEVNHTKDQYLTFELQVIPVPVTAVKLTLVSKDVTPKHCQMEYSTSSADGPWKFAWSFTIPESTANRSISLLTRHPDPEEMLRNETPGIVATWWRLLMLDNYGSQVCVALASPLKLYSSCSAYIPLMHSSRKEVKRTTVEGMIDEIEMQEDTPGPQPPIQLSKVQQLAISHGIDEEFVKIAHAAFDKRDKSNFCLWTKQDWRAWMLELAGVTKDEQFPEDRMELFWRQLDQDGSGGVDFEEFLLFYNWCVETARENQQTIEEFICPSGHPLVLKTKRSVSSELGSYESQSDLPEAVPRTEYADTHKKVGAVLRAVRVVSRMSMQSQAATIKTHGTLDNLAKHISEQRSKEKPAPRKSAYDPNARRGIMVLEED